MSHEIIDLIDGVLAEGEPDGHGVLGDEVCRWCGHAWHGVRCTPPTWWLAEPLVHGEPELWGCQCPSSLATERPAPPKRPARDDSWRPRPGHTTQDRLSQIMHETGMDGWAASAHLQSMIAGTFQVWSDAFDTVVQRVAEGWAQIGVTLSGMVGSDFPRVHIGHVETGRPVTAGAISADLRVRSRAQNSITFSLDGVDPRLLELLTGGLRDPEPDTPQARMQRALDARRNRNTGPPRPSGNQARRPRRQP